MFSGWAPASYGIRGWSSVTGRGTKSGRGSEVLPLQKRGGGEVSTKLKWGGVCVCGRQKVSLLKRKVREKVYPGLGGGGGGGTQSF